MSDHTNPSNTNAAEAQFLAPETLQQAGGEGMRALLQVALVLPGVVNQAYRAFHNYSMGNQLLAAHQLLDRGLPLSPIASFNAWREKGRRVKKGEKAICLFMPVSVKRKADRSSSGEAADAGDSFGVFMLRPHWFSLNQTEGDAFTAETITPAWDAVTAMAALDIIEEPFEQLQGNRLGYARARSIGLNPMNPLKHKTRFHEMAHVVLGHTEQAAMEDAATLSPELAEVEAEGVAYLMCSLLDLPGQAESRHYIQGWLRGSELPERSAKRIFGAANRIMKAGASVGLVSGVGRG